MSLDPSTILDTIPSGSTTIIGVVDALVGYAFKTMLHRDKMQLDTVDRILVENNKVRAELLPLLVDATTRLGLLAEEHSKCKSDLAVCSERIAHLDQRITDLNMDHEKKIQRLMSLGERMSLTYGEDGIIRVVEGASLEMSLHETQDLIGFAIRVRFGAGFDPMMHGVRDAILIRADGAALSVHARVSHAREGDAMTTVVLWRR